jgi:hypothetical protein
MNILRDFETEILNFKSVRSLLSALFVREARALPCEWRLEFGGVGMYDSDRRILTDLSKISTVLCTDFTSEQVKRVQNHRQKVG